MNHPQLTEIGKVHRTHGVNGELQVSWSNDFYPEDHKLESVFLHMEGIPIPFFIQYIRSKGANASLIKFDDIDDLPQAEGLIGLKVYAEIKQNQPDEEFFLDDLVGYTVITNHGAQIGVIELLQDYSGNLIFEIKDASGEMVLIPASPDFILEIDEESKTLVMELPEGLTDL